MQLIQVSQLPKGAVKDGEPLRLIDNKSIAQDYRVGDDLYEHVTRADGAIRIYKVQV